MNNQIKLTISVSIALATLFVLPWISLFEFSDTLSERLDGSRVNSRIVTLWLSTFGSAMVFFYFNFFRKKLLPDVNSNVAGVVLWMSSNGLLAIVLSVLLMVIMSQLIGVQVNKGFFIIYILRNLIILIICLLVVYAYEVSQQAKDNRIKLMAISREKAETELAILKNQLDPHFLFNNLSTLTWIIKSDRLEALKFVEHLADNFRYILDRKDNHLVTLEEELKSLESYIYLMQLRFKGALIVTIQVSQEAKTRLLPQHGLQLLLENAIKHNIVSENCPLEIIIRSKAGQVIVSNKYQPKYSSALGHGIGLANLNKRYKLLGYDSIVIINTDQTFDVQLPLI